MTSYYESFKLKADDKCRTLHKTVADLSKQLPKVRKRLQDEKDNRDKLQSRLEKMADLSVESLSGDVTSYERYKTSMKKLNVELAVSEEIVQNISTNILPNAEIRLLDAERNLKIVLNQLIHETRPVADEKINEFLRSCIDERDKFLDAWRTIYGDFGLHLIVNDESLIPGPWAALEIRDLRLSLGMGQMGEPPTPALPIPDIFGVPEAAQSVDNSQGGNNAPNSDDIFEQQENSDSEKIVIDG